MPELANVLYDALAHGDEEHRAWLRGCIDGALATWAVYEGLDLPAKVDGGPQALLDEGGSG